MPDLWFALFLAGCALGVGAGWSIRNIQLGRSVERLHEATRDGHTRLYARDMADGRSADRMPQDRYATAE